MDGIEPPIVADPDAAPALAVVAAAVGADVVAGATEIAEEPRPPAKIFVGGTSVKTTEDMIATHFSKYGTVTEAILIRNRHTNTPRGFGFVTFADHSALEKVLAEPQILDGRDVEVKLAVPRQMAPQPSRSRTRRAPPAEEPPAPAAGTKKIFVGGLHAKVDDETFRGYFEMFGEVVDAVVMFDRQTNRSRGFGFVTFANEDDARQVLDELHTILDKVVEVKAAQPKSERRSGGGSSRRSGGSSGGYGSYGGMPSHHGGGGYYRDGAPEGYGGGYERSPYAYGPYGGYAPAGYAATGYGPPRGYGGSEGYYPPTSSAYTTAPYGYGGGYAASGYPGLVGTGYPPTSAGYATAPVATDAGKGGAPVDAAYGAPGGYTPAMEGYPGETAAYGGFEPAGAPEDGAPAPASYDRAPVTAAPVYPGAAAFEFTPDPAGAPAAPATGAYGYTATAVDDPAAAFSA